MLAASMLIVVTGAAIWFLLAGPSESEFEVAEQACLSWIPGEEGMTDASVYDRRTKNGKIVIEVSGYISRLDGSFVVKCVYDPENRRMLRPGAFDSEWD